MRAIRVVMEFLLIFGKTNFEEVLKIFGIYSPQNKSTLWYIVEYINLFTLSIFY